MRLMTFPSCNETSMVRGREEGVRATSPHAGIAQRGWLTRRWEDREDVLADRRGCGGATEGGWKEAMARGRKGGGTRVS